METKTDTKTKITRLLNATNRNGMDKLIDWMDDNGFFTAPCSTKYHNSFEGGLAEHSWNVCQTCFSLLEGFYYNKGKSVPNDDVDSLVICALLHDLGKCGQFGKENYVLNNDLPFGAYETNKDLLYVPHEIRSIAIASQFIKLTEEEQFAILYHNGLYTELGKSLKGNETPLYMILHFADLWASRVLETEEK